MAGYHQGLPGQPVTFSYEKGPQDGFDFRAVDVWIEGVPRVATEVQPPGPGYQSRLTIEWD